MNTFRFAEPQWIHAIWLVAATTAALIALQLRRHQSLERLVSAKMQALLVRRVPLARRILSTLLLSGCMLSIVFGLMRPQWGMTVQAASRVNSQIMICLDVSKSMLAEDVVPNRLERAKAEIDSLLGLMNDGQQVGLIAFAGRAAVMCPMTTDFGFLRMILGETDPASIGLGGTRMGEAIGKAVDGFRQVGDVNRLIMLITDGEDHDSFPLDAAELAKERGVRIISIGFGDEAGSKIQVTAPATGVRSYVTDRDGNQVISRLDGETLRDIALKTEGAYIPAGTGALDLQSIYDTHIATLLRGTSAQVDHVVRNEAYQWCILLAVIFWFASLAMAANHSIATPTLANRIEQTATAVALFALFNATLQTSFARPQTQPQPSQSQTSADDQPTSTPQPVAPEPATEDQLDRPPRELYNAAVRYVSSEPDRAQRLLDKARNSAGVDGELRYRAIYNLGWVEINRADALLSQQPEEALKHLQLAAARFREAIRVRPDSNEARHNLEVVGRRILELTDSLTDKDPTDFAKRLDEVIAKLRLTQSELQQLLASDDDAVNNRAAGSSSREPLRKLATEQRIILSEVERLADDARRELAAAQSQDGEQPQERQLQLAQLTAMLGYVDRSISWMHKARSFARRNQPARSFLRWSAALAAAKRGRDQLRNPVEIISSIAADAQPLAMQTQLKSLTEEEAAADMGLPGWVSQEFLSESQTSIAQRTGELRDSLAAVVTQQADLSAEEDATTVDPADLPQQAQQAQLIASIEDALPALGRATERFEEASRKLELPEYGSAAEAQNSGLQALAEAAEFFFDIRRLIEAMHIDQRLVNSGLENSPAPAEPEVLGQFLDSLASAQGKNIGRGVRLKAMLQTELDKTQQSTPENPQTPQQDTQANAGPAEETELQQQRLQLALQLLNSIETEMVEAQKKMQQMDPKSLARSMEEAAQDDTAASPAPQNSAAPLDSDEPPSNDPAKAPVQEDSLDGRQEAVAPAGELFAEIQPHTEQAASQLEDLRRLFFSIVEHLRDTAQRQAELGDQTLTKLAQSSAPDEELLGPLAKKQQELHSVAQQIAEALQEQSAEAAQSATADPSIASNQANQAPAESADHAAAAETLSQAAELVGAGAAALRGASEALGQSDDDFDLDKVQSEQQTGLEKLIEAIRVLDDQQQQGDNNEGDQQQEEQQGQNDQQNDENGQQPSQQQNMSTSQMLQAIRDREAERRNDKKRAAVGPAGTVERDW